MANLHFLATDPQEETIIAVLKDCRDMKGKLQAVLRTHFDDDTLLVNNLKKVGKDYEGKFEASCEMIGEGDFTIELKGIDLY